MNCSFPNCSNKVTEVCNDPSHHGTSVYMCEREAKYHYAILGHKTEKVLEAV